MIRVWYRDRMRVTVRPPPMVIVTVRVRVSKGSFNVRSTNGLRVSLRFR